MKNQLRNVMVTVLATLSLTAASPAFSAQDVADNSGDDDASFAVGGSCAALAYTNGAQLKALIASGYTDDLHSFCFPEEPSECSDYTSFLKGLGRLVTGDDGYHCSLQLQM